MQSIEEQKSVIATKTTRLSEKDLTKIQLGTLLNEVLSDINHLADQLLIDHKKKYPSFGKRT